MKNRVLIYFKNPLSSMTVSSLKISQALKTHGCQQH
jgi:hypothetical protein